MRRFPHAQPDRDRRQHRPAHPARRPLALRAPAPADLPEARPRVAVLHRADGARHHPAQESRLVAGPTRGHPRGGRLPRDRGCPLLLAQPGRADPRRVRAADPAGRRGQPHAQHGGHHPDRAGGRQVDRPVHAAQGVPFDLRPISAREGVALARAIKANAIRAAQHGYSHEGDRELRGAAAVTIALRSPDLVGRDDDSENFGVGFEDPFLAVRIPNDWAPAPQR